MKKILFIVLILLPAITLSQTAPGKYWVQFTDKNNSPFSIDQPSEFLSFRAIDRRARYNIQITNQDLPVNPAYIDSVQSLGVEILNRSKWFNGITIATDNMDLLDRIRSFSFVSGIKTVKNLKVTRSITKQELIEKSSIIKTGLTDSTYYDYGMAAHQIAMVKGHILHNQGLRGQGMTIAILDGGFTNVNTNPAFDSLWQNNQIFGHWDFVKNQPLSFDTHVHGGHVLSIMAANIPGMMIGTAPKANYILLRTEDGGSEYLIEEDNWTAGAEYADSAGADLINTSLGYTEFDDPEMDHSYEDLDGNTTRITQAADIAATKGILVVTSASNQGNTSWQYIGAPADGDSVLAVGAVDQDGVYADFSSTGPTYDGRIKPNVSAMGKATVLVSSNGEVLTGNGTSYSSPLICGLAACLWQADKSANNMTVLKNIEMSSSQANNPDNYLGYGIPDFSKAFFGLLGLSEVNTQVENIVRTYPNPFSSQVTLDYYSPYPTNFSVRITNLNGQVVYEKAYNSGFINLNRIKLTDLGNLPDGTYLVSIIGHDQVLVSKIIKQAL